MKKKKKEEVEEVISPCVFSSQTSWGFFLSTCCIPCCPCVWMCNLSLLFMCTEGKNWGKWYDVPVKFFLCQDWLLSSSGPLTPLCFLSLFSSFFFYFPKSLILSFLFFSHSSLSFTPGLQSQVSQYFLLTWIFFLEIHPFFSISSCRACLILYDLVMRQERVVFHSWWKGKRTEAKSENQ